MPKPSVVKPEGSEVIADEVLDGRRRRTFSVQFKRRILEQATACENHGDIAVLLRKHGLYSSHLAQWRAQFSEGGNAALAAKPAGRKPRQDIKDRRIAELERQLAKLTSRLDLSEKLVALQKKAQELFAALASAGACQGSCRLKVHAATRVSVRLNGTTASRSGLSVTAPIGVQLRVVVVQRRGWRWRAA